MPAQNTTAPTAFCADPSALICLQNATALITPEGCGMPPQSAVSGELDMATLKWAQCACPKLTPIFEW